jgi:DNA-binding transcriptional ArsR family regulator
MRPFQHPSLHQLQLPQVLAALGDPLRLALVRQLASCPHGSPMNCAKAAETLGNIPLSTRHHHLRILREGGIIHSERKGVEVLNTLRRTELNQRFPGLLTTVLQQH